MTGNPSEGNIDRLVKARWLAMGLSQSDLAEVLGAAFRQAQGEAEGPSKAASDRLKQLADALGLSAGARGAVAGEHGEDPCAASMALEALLDLRLLRAFRELEDQRSKRMLIALVEQMVKRQAGRRGDG
jgi:transcriptional regulator with XRE-family HTH domain